MKRIVWLLILACCMQFAFAESAPTDGLYTIGVSSNAKMFKIMDCILRVEDGKMTAVLTMSGSGYGYLYQGTSAEADVAPAESWTPYFENVDGKHRFAIEIPYLDGELPMASWSIRYEKWYDRTLQFFSGTLSPYREIVADGVYSASIISDTKLNGEKCLIYSENESMRLEAGDMHMEFSSLDTRIPVDGGWIKVESLSLEPYSVTAPDGVYSAETKTDSGLLRFTDCRLTVAGGEMTALLTAKNNNFDYIYLGLAANANANQEDWIPAVPNGEGIYTYEIPVASLDNTIQVATYSAKKKLWYDREIIFDSQSLTEIK